MAQGTRDQGDEEYTSHLTPGQPRSDRRDYGCGLFEIMWTVATDTDGRRLPFGDLPYCSCSNWRNRNE